MSPRRLQKRLARALMVSWREQPTRYDIEALQANIRRVGLVVRVRWALIVVLVIYSVIAGSAYTARIEALELARLMWVPAFALGIVVIYNSFYALNYRRLGNIAVWNNLQLLLDAVIVTVLVYFSGGVNSWFWSMYSLFILEAAFILPRSRDVWTVALACMALLGAVEWLEFAGVLPHVEIPFAAGDFYRDAVFVSVRYLWQVAVLTGAAWVSTLLVGEFRQELEERKGRTMLDTTTGLYSRSYFMRAYPTELRRAQRERRPLHLLYVDLDSFGEFNRRFGLDAGDRLLQKIGASIAQCVADAGDIVSTTNIAARIGGEEFAVVLAEDARTEGWPRRDEALRLAEQLKTAVSETRIDGAGVTASIGLASSPSDGGTPEDLMDAADTALSVAIEGGGNKVIAAPESRTPVGAADL